MKNNKKKKEEKDFKTMPPDHDIIRGAWDCNYQEVENALNENPRCINAQDEKGRTAAHISVGLNNFSMLEFLADVKGFDPFIKDSFNRRAIDCIDHPDMQSSRKLLMQKMYGVFPEKSKGMRLAK